MEVAFNSLSSVFATILVLALRYGAVGETVGGLCPTNCSCSGNASSTTLAIDCHGRPDVKRQQLSEEVDSLLSSSVTYGRLTGLSISNCPLTHVPHSVCRLTTLTRLNLDRNRLTRLPDNCLSSLTALRSLTASNNSIGELQDGLFDGLGRLATLKLDYNQISSIGLGVFNSCAMLTSLSKVDLGHNTLTSLEPWPYFVLINGQLNKEAVVSVGNNNISVFTNRMGLRFSCDMKKVISGKISLETNNLKHITDIFKGWGIESVIGLLCLSPIRNGHPRFKFDLSGNRLDCDCIDFTYYKLLAADTSSYFLFGTFCDKPARLYHQRPTSVPLYEFVCELTERCPAGCRCVHRPANATLHVYCSNANLTVLPLELPQLPKSYTKYKLDLSDNRRLRRLEHRDYFVDTSILDVSNCRIETVENWTDVFRLKEVYLHGNRLTSLPRSVATLKVSAERMSLFNNPWTCFCDDRWMAKWLGSVSEHLLSNKYISCASPTRLYGKNILQTSDEEFCVDPVRRALAIGMSSVAGAAVVLLLIGVIVYRLRVKLYTRWKFHPFDGDECLGEDMHYDVFLSCSNNDNLPHGNGIRQQLEQRGYRVCYPPRDFVAGDTIFDNIHRSVVSSKRTVCLLTQHFLESVYCLHEFDVALHHNIIVKRKKRLVVLMALDSPADLHAGDASDTAALREYVRRYTYIDYTADDWLDRLLYALPVDAMDRRDEGRAGSELEALDVDDVAPQRCCCRCTSLPRAPNDDTELLIGHA